MTPDDLLELHRLATITRIVDERLWTLARQGRAGFVLTGRGQEIAQIASAMTLRVGVDSAWLYYRDLGAAIALGVPPYEVFTGALMKATDPHSAGRQLTAHFASPERRIGSMSSVVAGHIPHAVGAAYAHRVLGEDAIAMCWFGDGASSEGSCHEAMNLAAIHQLPVVFLCENNGYAISTPAELQMHAPVAARAAGYGMPGATIDGCDPDAVHDTVTAAVDRARAGEGPSLVEMLVPRMVAHSSQDDDGYRTDEDRAAAAGLDPLVRLRTRLLADALLDDSAIEVLEKEVTVQVRADLDRALAEPDVDGGRAQRFMFAEEPA